MLHNDCAVALANGMQGYVRRLAHASQGHRWWVVDWDNGTDSVADESVLIDVEAAEWSEALELDTPERLCHSLGPKEYPRRCALPAGHRTRLHRSCEVSWTDAMAVQ